MSSNIASGYTPEQDDVLKTLGLAVVAGQGVERLMSTCLTFVLRDEPLVSPEQLDEILRRHSKATLGQLLRILRERVDLHPTFDERFERFLESRNIIAHRLFDVPGGLDLHSDDGRKNLKAFLLRFMEDGQSLSMIFLGLIRSWSQQVGIDLPSVDAHATKAMLDHVDENVIPHLSTLLKEKTPAAGSD
ncbi:hypothetical protein ACQ86G_21150 [Roseateles chitinivorans]|uniref:hypothetical protein n=1 Tax=Roseateles chitinivorans TaxID=2917965 RepID=UPI003D670221